MNRTIPQVTLHATGETRHQPYLLAGLTALEEAGEITLRVVPRAPRLRDRLVVSGDQCRRIARAYPWSYRLDIRDPGSRRTVRAAVDLQDWKHFFSRGDLASCDVLFKRSYDPKIAALIGSKFGIAVLPAGMTHSAALDGRHGKVFAAARLAAKVEGFMTSPRRGVGALWKLISTPNRRGSGEKSQRVSPPFPENLGTFAFFQIQCHGDGSWTEAEQLNRARADLIRALRSSLGQGFQGGMYFEGPPRREFADTLSNLPNSPKEYLRLVDQAAVVISTNGFGGSFPWKLCEYMSLGKCIVTQTPAFPLPAPLTPGGEVVFFDTLPDCGRLTAGLLADAPARQRMGAAAREYYANQVSPAAAARRYVQSALGILTSRKTGLS